jgi:hypothetical protein
MLRDAQSQATITPSTEATSSVRPEIATQARSGSVDSTTTSARQIGQRDRAWLGCKVEEHDDPFAGVLARTYAKVSCGPSSAR